MNTESKAVEIPTPKSDLERGIMKAFADSASGTLQVPVQHLREIDDLRAANQKLQDANAKLYAEIYDWERCVRMLSKLLAAK